MKKSPWNVRGLLLAAVLTAGPALAQTAGSLEEGLKKGKALLDQGNPGGALVSLREVSTAHPEAYKPLFYMAIAAYRLDQFDSAETYARSALAKAPAGEKTSVEEMLGIIADKRKFAALVRQAEEALDKGLLARGADTYRQAYFLFPNQGAIGLKAAALYSDRLNRLLDAAQIWQKILGGRDSASTTIALEKLQEHAARLDVLMRSELRWAGDLKRLKQLAEIFPQRPDPFVALGRFHARRKEATNAIYYLGQANRVGLTPMDVVKDADFLQLLVEPETKESFGQFLTDAFETEAVQTAQAGAVKLRKEKEEQLRKMLWEKGAFPKSRIVWADAAAYYARNRDHTRMMEALAQARQLGVSAFEIGGRTDFGEWLIQDAEASRPLEQWVGENFGRSTVETLVHEARHSALREFATRTNALRQLQAELGLLDADRNPSAWAEAQMALGIVNTALGDETDSANKQLRLSFYARAAQAFRAALTKLDPERTPTRWAEAQMRLAAALYGSFWAANSEAEEAFLRQGIEACDEALRVYTPKEWPVQWSELQNSLRRLYQNLAQSHTKSEQHYAAAIAAARAANRFLTPENSSWSLGNRELARLLFGRAQRQDWNKVYVLGDLGEAVKLYRSVMEVYPRAKGTLPEARWNAEKHLVRWRLRYPPEVRKDTNVIRFLAELDDYWLPKVKWTGAGAVTAMVELSEPERKKALTAAAAEARQALKEVWPPGTPSYLGVRFQMLDKDLVEECESRWGLKLYEKGTGPWVQPGTYLIASIDPLGPAALAGLQENDLVFRVSGVYSSKWEPVRANDFVERFKTLPPGTKVGFEFLRAGVKDSIKVTLTPAPKN